MEKMTHPMGNMLTMADGPPGKKRFAQGPFDERIGEGPQRRQGKPIQGCFRMSRLKETSEADWH